LKLAMTTIALVVVGWALATHASFGQSSNLPNKRLTPGWYNPFVRQSNIQSTICVSGYSASVRPSYGYTSALKKMELKFRRMPGSISDYELDHFVPLELGGNPYDTRNLWLEAWDNAHKSDPYENKLHKMVCDGSITLKQARMDIIDFKRANG
jgi:hypothetical protein